MPDSVTTEDAVQNVRPLSPTQAKYLEKIVNGDFNKMRMEIEQMAGEALRARQREIRAGTDEEAKARLLDRARSLRNRFHAEVNALITEAQVMGMEISNLTRSVDSTDLKLNDKVLSQRLSEAHEDHKKELKSALNILETQREAALRKVYQASITGMAENVLNSIPSAQELMVEAAQERARREI